MISYPKPLLTLFGIQPNETRPVALLMALYFFLGVAIVLTQTIAFALFISTHGPQMLPYAYLLTAVGAALAAFIYLRVGERLAFPTLLSVNLIFLVVASLLYYWGLTSTGALALVAIFGLPLWFQVMTNLGNLAFWALAGRLFTVRQGKRLFGLVSTGSWIATIAGGFIASPLIRWAGMPSLLVVSAVSLMCGWLVLQVILRTCLSPPKPSSTTSNTTATKAMSSLFRSRYVWLIFAFLFVWWLGFNIIHSIYSDHAARQFADANQLGAFLGDIAGLSGVLALITTGLFTAPVLQRYGLWGGLLIMPIVVTLVIAGLAGSGTVGASALTLFMLATFAKVMNVGLGFGLDQPAHSILYKPLPGHQIGRVPIIAEGIVQPLAVGSAGLILLIFGTWLGVANASIGMSYLFVVIGAVWITITLLLIRVYRTALSDALAKRRLDDLPRALLDQTSIALLTHFLHDPYPGAVIYALHALDQLDQLPSSQTLSYLMTHPAVEVRREVLIYIEQRAVPDMVDQIKQWLSAEPVAEVREVGLRALAATSPTVVSDLAGMLNHPEMADRRGAMVGLLRHGGIDGVMLAGQSFNRMLMSTQAEDRVLAAQVLGAVGVTHFYQPVLGLLNDESPAVRCAALQAAGNIKHPTLWPQVILACDYKATLRHAVSALVMGGEAVLPWMARALAEPGLSWATQRALIHASGQIRGDQALQLLIPLVSHPQSETRTQVFAALSQSNYHPTGPEPRQVLRAQIQQELALAADVAAWSLQIQLKEGTPTPAMALLVAALAAELQQARNRTLHLLSFLYDAPTMLKARQTLMARDYGPVDPTQLAYAIELIDTQLPPDSKTMVLPLIEVLPLEQRLMRLGTQSAQVGASAANSIVAMIDEYPQADAVTPWTQACALYVVGVTQMDAAASIVLHRCNDQTPLVRQMAGWAWKRLQLHQPDAAGQQNAPETQASEVNPKMLSIIEKVIILKTVSVFAQTPDAVLSEVAELLEEMALDSGAVVFQKGEPGDGLYLIVQGKVQVQDGSQVLRQMGEREVFGEMALLDNEPRSATVMTVEPTQLLRLAQTPFYELLAERPEIATGIIRVLMGYIRNLNQRLAEIGKPTSLQST